MPWWIWLILALFMLAMIVAGLIYAALHGIRALKDMSDIGGQLAARPPSANATPRHGPAGSDSTTNGKQQWHVTNTIRAMPIPRR